MSVSTSQDVLIVGAGPGGLASALLLAHSGVKVTMLEKSSEVGAHIISGNVFETRALDELLPDWINSGLINCLTLQNTILSLGFAFKYRNCLLNFFGRYKSSASKLAIKFPFAALKPAFLLLHTPLLG